MPRFPDMMKLLGSVFLLLGGLLWGFSKARELWQRERLLGQWQRLIESLKTGVSFAARPLGDLIREDGSPFCREAAASPLFSQNPQQALLQAGKRLLPRQGDKALYQGFAQGLGTSDAAGQLRHLELYASLVGQALLEAREERDKRSRLYICLGLFGGLTLCLLLL